VAICFEYAPLGSFTKALEADASSGYFDNSYDSIRGVVYRPEFEAQLHLHFQSAQEDNVAQYALRNAVYAVGCRVSAVKDKEKTFEETQRISLLYFHNALSVYSDLLFMPSGLTGVQALVVMVRYLMFLSHSCFHLLTISDISFLDFVCGTSWKSSH
jgi:hypothetical protein